MITRGNMWALPAVLVIVSTAMIVAGRPPAEMPGGANDQNLFLHPVMKSAEGLAFDENAARDHVRVLASDAMQGRKSGEAGYDAAAAYVAARLREGGLEPAGPGGSYFQELTFEYFKLERGAVLEIVTKNMRRALQYRQDWRIQRYSGSGMFAGDVVFIGYGISAPEKGYDDYAGVDVKNRVALMCTEDPPDRFGDLGEGAHIRNRLRAVRERGARGVLTFESSPQTGFFFRGFNGALPREDHDPDFIIITLEPHAVEAIFQGQQTDARALMRQMEISGKSRAFLMDNRCSIRVKTVLGDGRATRNVLARIRGADEKLQKECVIVGAHLDHLGTDADGNVFPGADDNASGSAVVMEVARAMQRSRPRPKRTIVFAFWAAEEDGLLGSKFYTERPVYPLAMTAVYVNLDMVGQGNGKVRFHGVDLAPELWRFLAARLPGEIAGRVLPSRSEPGGSDYRYFRSRGVPNFDIVSDGDHLETHQIGDSPDLINLEVLKNVGTFTAKVVEAMSSETDLPLSGAERKTYLRRYRTTIGHAIRRPQDPSGAFLGLEKSRGVVVPEKAGILRIVGYPDPARSLKVDGE